MAEGGTPFPQPPKVHFNQVGQRAFQTAHELQAWAEEEHQFWQAINDKIGEDIPFQTDFFLNPLISRPQQISNLCGEFLAAPNEKAKSNTLARLEGQLSGYESPHGLTREGPAASVVARLAETNPVAAWLALAFQYDGKRSDSQFLTSEQIKAPIALLKAIDVVRAETFDARAAAASMDQALEEVRTRWEQNFQNRFDDMAARLARVSRHASTWRRIARDLSKDYKELHADHKNRMDGMEKSFSTDMRLRAAEKFWQAKRKVNRRLASKAMTRAYFGGFFGLIALCCIWWVINKNIGMPDKLNLTHALIYSVPTIIYIWLLRIFATEHKVNQRLADDAEQRQAMVMTFKALEYEEKASDNERIIILNALFRPQDPATEEAVPVAALETIMSKSR